MRFLKNQYGNWRIDRPLEMTSYARQKCGNLHYAILYNLIWTNQRTESFEYHWLRALPMFDITRFSAILSGIGRLFIFCRYVNYIASTTVYSGTDKASIVEQVVLWLLLLSTAVGFEWSENYEWVGVPCCFEWIEKLHCEQSIEQLENISREITQLYR